MPDCDQVRKTILKSRRSRKQLELASLELEEIIAQLEIASLQKRRQHLTDQVSSS
ncbi:MAG: hypothetical protein AAGA80_24130 [Cyanobacteria bacterium P01_F01_bin.143]